MFLRIETLTEKKLIGMHLRMSFADNKTPDLWKAFMPKRGEIQHRASDDLISMSVYDDSFDFQQFNPQILFDKWAAAEVSQIDAIPEGMETFTLPSGLYAVFLHKGPPSAAPQTFGYIFGAWLPQSEYTLDNRPHFEVIGAKYKNNDPDSEEEVWIPVRKR